MYAIKPGRSNLRQAFQGKQEELRQAFRSVLFGGDGPSGATNARIEQDQQPRHHGRDLLGRSIGLVAEERELSMKLMELMLLIT